MPFNDTSSSRPPTTHNTFTDDGSDKTWETYAGVIAIILLGLLSVAGYQLIQKCIRRRRQQILDRPFKDNLLTDDAEQRSSIELDSAVGTFSALAHEAADAPSTDQQQDASDLERQQVQQP